MTKANDSKKLNFLSVKHFINRHLKEKTSGVLCDTNEHKGLRVSVSKTGKVSWIFRYTNAVGMLKQIKMGAASARSGVGLSVAEAQLQVEKYRAMHSSGIDPLHSVKAAKQKHKEEIDQAKQNKYTVAKLMEDYIVESVCNRNAKGIYEAERLIKKDIIPKFGRLSAHNLTKAMVHEHMHKIIKERKTPVQAGYMVRELKAAYEHAFSADRLPSTMRNPCQGIKRPPSKSRNRYLSPDEIVKLVNWIPLSKLSANSKSVLLLTLLTGCRSGEITALAWEQIDLERGTIQLTDTKTNVPRNVQLSTQVINIFKRLKGTAINEWVFPSNRPPCKAIRQHSVNLQVNYNRESSGIKDWSAHDLRRTCRTTLSTLGCTLTVGEAIIGHCKGDRGVYDLYESEPEQKVWLQNWADYIDSLVKLSLEE